jgi:DMSO/TMAO reductase YedYZ molybdopterin-dependent catalytic subunit
LKKLKKASMKNKYLALTLITTILGILLVAPFGSGGIAESAPNLEIINLSGDSSVFTYAQVLAMPKTVVNADLYCDGALVTYGDWGGVLLSYLLMQGHANSSEVGSVRFMASDGYQATIPVTLAMDPQVIVAYEMNAQPLIEGLRLILPGANGASWIAEIIAISVSTSGAAYPQAISVSPLGGRNADNVAPTQNPTPQPSPTQQQAPVEEQPSAPENTPTIQEPTPSVTQPASPTAKPVESNANLNLQTILYVIGFMCAISLSAGVYFSFRHRRK